MKFTNVKQLIIKFMGGGLINFPTRFLRWVKIDGDAEGDDGGGDGGDDSIVDIAVSFYNEHKNDNDFYINKVTLEEYNDDYKEYTNEEYGNGDNVVVMSNDETIAFKFTDDEFAEFMHKIAIFNDWRNSFISFPITNVISFNDGNSQELIEYQPALLGEFGGAILGYSNYIDLGLTGEENFIKLNSIADAGNMFFLNNDWIYRRTQQLGLNGYNFNQVFDSEFDIYKLKCGHSNNIEFGLIKIVDKEDERNIMFTTYNTYAEH